jgi:hypothetical protein
MRVWELIQSFYQASVLKGNDPKWSDLEIRISRAVLDEAVTYSLVDNFDGTSGRVLVWDREWNKLSENQQMLFARAMACQCNETCRVDVKYIKIVDFIHLREITSFQIESLRLCLPFTQES